MGQFKHRKSTSDDQITAHQSHIAGRVIMGITGNLGPAKLYTGLEARVAQPIRRRVLTAKNEAKLMVSINRGVFLKKQLVLDRPCDNTGGMRAINRRVWPRRPLAWFAYSCVVTSLHGTYWRHVCANFLLRAE